MLLAHHLLAHGWALRPRRRPAAGHPRRAPTCRPLGAGALAGSSLPLDPEVTAEELGFARAPSRTPSTPCRDRDFVAEALFDLALIGVHLSRIGEEVVLWSTEEFGFLTLDDAYTTGSSMLPAEEEPRHRRAGPGQDRPADRQPHRPARRRSRACRSPTTATCRRTRSRCSTRSTRCSLALAAIERAARPRRRSTSTGWQAAADAPHAAATDLAEQLVAAGMPFRDAHAVVGRARARRARATGSPLADLVRGRPRPRRGGRRAARARRVGHPAHHAGRCRARPPVAAASWPATGERSRPWTSSAV